MLRQQGKGSTATERILERVFAAVQKKASSQTSDTHGNCALRKRKTKRCYEHSFQFARGAELLAKASDKGDAQAGYTLAMLHLASEVTGFPDGAF